MLRTSRPLNSLVTFMTTLGRLILEKENSNEKEWGMNLKLCLA